MIWLLSTRGAGIAPTGEPGNETMIEGVHSVVYRPGIDVFAFGIDDRGIGEPGTFARGLQHISGYVYSYDGSAAETLFAQPDGIDLVIHYRADSGRRKRTFVDVIFIGNASVTIPSINEGVSRLIGVPFRVHIPAVDQLWQHVIDEADA